MFNWSIKSSSSFGVDSDAGQLSSSLKITSIQAIIMSSVLFTSLSSIFDSKLLSMNWVIDGYFNFNERLSSSLITFLCLRSFFILIESTSTVTATCVLLSSGHTIFTSIVSPTDFDRMFKNKYSISNVASVSSFIPLESIHELSISITEFVICLESSDSNAIMRIFSSLTRKGLYFIFFPDEGNANS